VQSHSDKKKWAKPRVQSVDRGVLETWDRDKLVRVRDLVQRSLEIVEASGQVPEAVMKLRVVLDQIDALAE
jgi:hypothetical protein